MKNIHWQWIHDQILYDRQVCQPVEIYKLHEPSRCTSYIKTVFAILKKQRQNTQITILLKEPVHERHISTTMKFCKVQRKLLTGLNPSLNETICLIIPVLTVHPTINDTFKMPLYVLTFFSKKNTFMIKIHFNMLGEKNKKMI